jgi:hypothetical protein
MPKYIEKKYLMFQSKKLRGKTKRLKNSTIKKLIVPIFIILYSGLSFSQQHPFCLNNGNKSIVKNIIIVKPRNDRRFVIIKILCIKIAAIKTIGIKR